MASPAECAAHDEARIQEEKDKSAFSTMFKMFFASFGAGSVVLPILLILVSVVTLPNPLSTAYLGLMLLLALIPIAPRGPLATRFTRNMCMAASSWLSLRVICNETKFTTKGPYVIGARHNLS
jgi:hypothetical protein